jgi:hypothetical protein
MRIENKHIFQVESIDTVNKLLFSIKYVLQLMDKKHYYEKISGEYLYYYYDYKSESFVLHNKKEDLLIKKLNNIENKKRFKNSNKLFVFKLVDDVYYFYGLFYRKDKLCHIFDDSDEFLNEVFNLSDNIRLRDKLQSNQSYRELYNKFILHLKNKTIVVKLNNENKNIKVEDLLLDKKLHKNKKILYNNKKYSYNSIKLYNMIIENKKSITSSLFEKIKYDLLSIFICRELCEFLNSVKNEKINYTICDKQNKINYKIVNYFNIDYNVKEDKDNLLPPLLPIRI